jgi:hypothetical protein
MEKEETSKNKISPFAELLKKLRPTTIKKIELNKEKSCLEGNDYKQEAILTKSDQR